MIGKEIVADAFANLAHALGTAFKESPGDPWPDDVFDSWAQRVFAYQFETNPVYAAYARKRGVTPSTGVGWREIPWVPASAFRAVPLVSGGLLTGAARFPDEWNDGRRTPRRAPRPRP